MVKYNVNIFHKFEKIVFHSKSNIIYVYLTSVIVKDKVFCAQQFFFTFACLCSIVAISYVFVNLAAVNANAVKFIFFTFCMSVRYVLQYLTRLSLLMTQTLNVLI